MRLLVFDKHLTQNIKLYVSISNNNLQIEKWFEFIEKIIWGIVFEQIITADAVKHFVGSFL